MMITPLITIDFEELGIRWEPSRIPTESFENMKGWNFRQKAKKKEDLQLVIATESDE